MLFVVWVVWWLWFGVGIYIEAITNPHQVWWLNVWKGALGGNGFNAFGASVLSILLTAEVIYMVVSWLIRQQEQRQQRQRMMEAEKTARAEGHEAGREESRKEWREWYESIKEDLEAGRPPSTPPPNSNDESADPER
ncbi:MAG: hypothetical protein F4X65_06850 [Chloroflexi bacterium]|nr:hypothetical protein [Chloroflexota bacterium]